MPRNESYLNSRAKAELVHFIAVNGENYDGYVRFAEKNGWRLFTKRYLHNWVGRHRAAIRVERQRHLFDLRKQSLLDRAERLRMLEESAKRLEKRLDVALAGGDDERAVKLAEQLRKQLEAVAKERGEWMSKEAGAGQLEGIHESLLANMQRALLGQPGTVEADGVYEVEVEPATPAV